VHCYLSSFYKEVVSGFGGLEVACWPFFFFFSVVAEPGLCSPDALRRVGLLCTA
jgi:hypothetical protein